MWEIEETQRQRIAFGAGVFDDSATPSQNRSFLRFWRLRPAATSGHPQPSHRFGSRTQPAVLCDQTLDKGREKSGEGGGGRRRGEEVATIASHVSTLRATRNFFVVQDECARTLFARELGLFSRRPFDSGGPRPIPTDPFGWGLCRLADMWVSGPVVTRMQSKLELKIEFKLNFKLNFEFKKTIQIQIYKFKVKI